MKILWTDEIESVMDTMYQHLHRVRIPQKWQLVLRKIYKHYEVLAPAEHPMSLDDPKYAATRTNNTATMTSDVVYRPLDRKDKSKCVVM